MNKVLFDYTETELEPKPVWFTGSVLLSSKLNWNRIQAAKMAAHSNTVTQLIPIVFDFLFADDDALLTSGTDKVDIKQQGLCLSSMRRDRPRCIAYVEEVIPGTHWMILEQYSVWAGECLRN